MVRVLVKAGRFRITSPRFGDLIPGRVSGPLPLLLSGLGVMRGLFIIANGSKYLMLITEND
jgi:hypothetical protein